MSASASSSSINLAPDNFRPLLEALVDKRYRRYDHSVAVSFSWEADDTRTHKDVENFQDILATLGLVPAEEIKLRLSQSFPGWDVQDKLKALVKQEMDSEERVLLLIHYAGQAYTKNGSLVFTNSQNHRTAHWERDFVYIVDSDSPINDSHKIDVLFILDSCYSYLESRQYTTTKRVVQVLATVNENTGSFLSTENTAPLTGKLLNELRTRKQAGATSVDLAELISDLREKSPQKKPVHELLVGSHSLRLAFPRHETGLTTIPSKPTTKVVFGLRLVEGLSREAMEDFLRWLKELPDDIGLSLDAVYGINSMYLIFRAPWRLWTQLACYTFVQELCEARTPNLLLSTPATE